MTVKQYLLDKIDKGTIHVTLLDPEDQTPEKAAEMAKTMQDAGTDAFFIGGSTGITSENLGSTAKAIKEATGLPVLYFPGSPEALSNEVDAILFMSILNSKDPRFITAGQAFAAPIVRKLRIEPISMGYIIVEPGMTVAKVTQAKVIPRDNPEKAVAYAMAGEMLGMSLIYLEAGSGAGAPVPPEMIAAVKKNIGVPLIVGGGIRTPEAAAAAHKAGADVVVTGTIVEESGDTKLLKDIVSAAKGL